MDINTQIRNYLLGESYQSLLIVGKKKDALEAAELVVSEILKGELETHPDFMRIALAEGEKSLGVEQAQNVIEKSGYNPGRAPRRVCIIEDMDKMTVQAQNKILKLVEESKTTLVIGVISDIKRIVDTIVSRCQVITFRYTGYSSYEGDDVQFFLEGLGNRIVAKPYFEAVKDAVSSGKPELILKGLSMVAEKDDPKKPTMFFAVCREGVAPMISFMGRLALDNQEMYGSTALDAARLCSLTVGKSDTQSFTKDSFFVFVAEYISMLKKGDK